VNAHTFPASSFYASATAAERHRVSSLFPPDPCSFMAEKAARDFVAGTPASWPFKHPPGVSEFGRLLGNCYLRAYRGVSGATLTREEAEETAYLFPL
jgi:hypothetical protein